MTIKPVLVPDHDAATLRRLMDHFAEAATGPTRQQLAESRAAVTAARKTITEGSISDLLNQDPTSPKFNDHPGASRLKKAEGDPKPVTTGHFADKKGQPKPYPALKNTSTGKVRAHPNDPEQGVAEGPDKGWVPNPDNPGYYIHRSDLPQTGKVSDPAKAKLGRIINKYFGQIYDYGDGDESLNYLDNNAPLWFDLFDKHDGDIDAIIANEPADVLKQAALELKNVANDLKYELDEQVVTEGFMDTVKQAFNDCVVGYPQGTSEGQFIQGWARAIRAETGRDIPLEKLTRLYQDYAERSDEIMQSHGTLDEGSAEDNLNELDKSTLGSYVKKAAADVNTKSRDAQQHKDMWAGNYPVRGAKKQARQNQADIDKRVGGISRAVDRLAAEDVAEGEGMSRAAKGYEKYGREGMAEMWGNPYDDDKVDAINAANPPKRSTPYTPPSTPAKHYTYDRNKAVAANISGEDSAAYDRFTGRDKDMAEATGQQLNIQQLATISDEALDNEYHYGRSSPGNTFGWQANLASAAYAKQAIESGITNINQISDAVHKGWWSVAQKFVDDPDQFDDTETLRVKGKFDKKMADRIAQMVPFNQLTPDQQKIDTVVARALLQAIKGQPGVAESADLSEFAPSDSGDGGGDDDGFDEDTLRKLAAQWFNGDEDPQVERLLAAAGWEIGQDEGYDNEPGVFVVLSGDADGRSYMSWPAEELRSDVAEAQPDVMRHKGDQTVRVVKKGGKPIGEIGIDAEASEGNGSYYVKLYDGSYDAVGFDTAEEALAELKAAISEGITETADGVKYGVFAKGGSVGSQRFRDDPLKTFDTKEEATADARRRRSGLSKGERGYYRMGYVVKPIKGEVDEGLKQKVAGAVLAGAAALGAGGAQAQTTDKYDTAWGTSGYDTSIRSDKSLTRSMGSDPSKDVNDFQKRIQSVTGPNARGEYKVVVIQGNDIVSHYVTKTPPPGWLYKEDAESKTEEGMIDDIKNIKNTVRAANYDRLARRSNSQAVAGGGLAPPAQFRALSAKGDQRAQKAQDIRKGDVAEGYDAGGAYDKWDPKHPDFVKNFRKFQASNPGATLKDFIADLKKGVTESIDPIEQLRADIRRFAQ